MAYTAEQPKGYTLKTIPAGWVVDEALQTHLSLRRSDTPTGGDWLDKIVVTGGYDDMPGPGSQRVRINGLAGWLDTDDSGFVRVVGYDTGRTVERPESGHGGAPPARPPGMPEPAATNTGDGKQNRAAQNSGLLGGVPVAPPADGVGPATDMTTFKVTIQLPEGLNWQLCRSGIRVRYHGGTGRQGLGRLSHRLMPPNLALRTRGFGPADIGATLDQLSLSWTGAEDHGLSDNSVGPSCMPIRQGAAVQEPGPGVERRGT